MTGSKLFSDVVQTGVVVDKDLDALFQSTAGYAPAGLQTNAGLQNDSSTGKRRRASPEKTAIGSQEPDDEQQTSPKRVKLDQALANTSISQPLAESTSVRKNSKEDGSRPAHISRQIQPKSSKTSQNTGQVPKQKFFAPANETEKQRSARTVFVGNFPAEAVTQKPILKEFLRLVASAVPGSKVESTRFRSLAFQTPSKEAGNSADDPTGEKAKPKADANGADASDSASKSFLKKVSFIKKELHEKMDRVHLYIVFAHPSPDRSPNVPPILDPYEAARMAVQNCDNMVFRDRTLRVDHAEKSKADAKDVQQDVRRTLFIGNLDFETKEEQLRAFLTELISRDTSFSASESPSAEPSSNGIKSLRIVRDGSTQLGKGFAYVEMMDKNLLDEVLLIPKQNLKLGPRTLRFQRWRAEPKDHKKTTSLPSGAPKGVSRKPHRSLPARQALPRNNNEDLGTRIKHLDKESRRVAKASDPARQARRLEKKRSKIPTNDRQPLSAKPLKRKVKGSTKDPRRRSSKSASTRTAGDA